MSILPIGNGPSRVQRIPEPTTSTHPAVRGATDSFAPNPAAKVALDGAAGDSLQTFLAATLRILEQAVSLISQVLEQLGAQQPQQPQNPGDIDNGVVPPQPPGVTPGEPQGVLPQPPVQPPVEEPVAPQPPVTDPPPTADRNGFPWISQLNPAKDGDDVYRDGDIKCGPALMASVARKLGKGEKYSDAELIDRLAAIGMTDRRNGTSLNGMLAMARALGQDVDRGEVWYRGRGSDGVAFVERQLAQGKPVVANGAIQSKETGRRIEHYVLVTGKDAQGNYQIVDPLDQKHTTLAPEDLQSFFARHWHRGAAFALG